MTYAEWDEVGVDLLKFYLHILMESAGGRYESHDHRSIVVHTIKPVPRLVIGREWLGDVYKPLVSSAFHMTSPNTSNSKSDIGFV